MALATLTSRGARVTPDASIADLVTYRIGGPVAALVRIGTEAELEAVTEVVAEHLPPVLVIGRGSNLLVADGKAALFGTYCIADSDLALMLQRLALSGHAIGAKLEAFVAAQWARPSVREWNEHARPAYEAY